MRRILAPMLVLLQACNMPLWTPPPPRPVALATADRRARFIGTWNIEFRLDSAQDAPAANTAVIARGTVTLLDTIIANGPDGLKGTVELDFTPILGRQISCFRGGERVFPIAFRHDSVTLALTPGARHCGLWMIGRAEGDTVSGRWFEGADECCPSVGRFVMRRTN